jgi:hypothetical protein
MYTAPNCQLGYRFQTGLGHPYMRSYDPIKFDIIIIRMHVLPCGIRTYTQCKICSLFTGSIPPTGNFQILEINQKCNSPTDFPNFMEYTGYFIIDSIALLNMAVAD